MSQGNEVKTSPISPSRARKEKANRLPNFVIEAFNELIVAKLWANKATFSEEEILNIISEKSGKSYSEIKKSNWLKVEPIYRRKGWVVVFDRSGLGNQPSFSFTKRKRSKKKSPIKKSPLLYFFLLKQHCLNF